MTSTTRAAVEYLIMASAVAALVWIILFAEPPKGNHNGQETRKAHEARRQQKGWQEGLLTWL